MDLDPSVVWDFAGTLVGTLRERPRQLPATVSRVDPDGTVWLSMPGADGLVPASTTADVQADDSVTVEWWGNTYHVTGNRTSPSVGTRAAAALRRATAAAAKVAGEAKGIADAVGQHFWADDNGVHVSNEDGNATGERNILMNSLGILLRQGSAWLASFSDSVVAFYDGLGNAAANIVAQFGAAGAVIGRANESHVEIDYHSFQMLDRELSSYLHVSDMRDHDGYAEIVEYLYGEWVTSGNTVGLSLSPVVGDIPEGYQNNIVAYGIDYPDGHEVQCTFLSSGRVRFDETLQYIQNLVITYVTESPQAKAYTLGVREAAETVGPMSVCEGMHSAASGFASHAEGYGCESKGIASHSGGRGCKALGEASHASGDTCVAASYAQTVVGMNNVPDYSGEYAFIVGNGGSELRPSNAFAVGWDGNVMAQAMAGIIQMFAGATPPSGWLVCDGSAVSRTTYATLFAAIGTTWGTGNGSTTFNLPDLRGRAPIGAGTGTGLSARSVGDFVGSEYLQAHTHAFTNPTITTKFAHTGASGSARDLVNSSGTITGHPSTATGGAVGAVTGVTTGNDGNMQPSAVVNFIICTGKTS